MLRLVLDTNTLISAIGWKGKPREILLKCIKGKYKLLESRALLKELADVLNRPKFNFITGKEKKEFLGLLLKIAEVVHPKAKLNVIKTDPADNRVLECALAGKADYIVSGDSHLLNLKKYKKIKIVNAGEFLESI